MMVRSTRNKIKWQSKKLIENLNMAIEHLARLDMLADGKSNYISTKMPMLAVVLDGILNIFQDFDEGL